MIIVVVQLLAIPLVLRSGIARVAYFILGGLLTLGPAGITTPKLFYLAGVVAVVAISILEIIKLDASTSLYVRPAIGASAVIAVGIGLGVTTGLLEGSPIDSILRDGISYIMLTAAPIIAMGAARDLRGQLVNKLVALVGSLSAIGFAVDWLNRRGVAALPIDRFAFGSPAMIAFAFSFAVVVVCLSTRIRVGWLAVATLMPISTLITGSRGGVAIFASLLGIFGKLEKSRVPVRRLALLAVAIVALVAVAIPIMGRLVISDPNFLQQRLAAAVQVVESGADEDQSFQDRLDATNQATKVIIDSPIVGGGLGYQFYRTQRNETISTSSLDSPLAPVAKLGLIGAFVILSFLGLILLSIRRIYRVSGSSIELTACSGFALVMVANIPFGYYFEDKGLSFVVCIALLSLSAKAMKARDMEADTGSTVSVSKRNLGRL